MSLSCSYFIRLNCRACNFLIIHTPNTYLYDTIIKHEKTFICHNYTTVCEFDFECEPGIKTIPTSCNEFEIGYESNLQRGHSTNDFCYSKLIDFHKFSRFVFAEK